MSQEYDRLSRSQLLYQEVHSANSKMFGDIAVVLLEELDQSEAFRTIAAVDSRVVGVKVSPLDVAIASHNTKFVSHYVVQRFLAYLWRGLPPLECIESGYRPDQTLRGYFIQLISTPDVFFSAPCGHYTTQLYSYILFVFSYLNVCVWTT